MEIIIGTGDYGYFAKLCDIAGDPNISENNESYWCRDLIFDAELIVFKDTEEGRMITAMIVNKTDTDNIIEYLNALVLKRIPVQDALSAIEHIQNSSFIEGRNCMQRELRCLLGINS